MIYFCSVISVIFPSFVLLLLILSTRKKIKCLKQSWQLEFKKTESQRILMDVRLTAPTESVPHLLATPTLRSLFSSYSSSTSSPIPTSPISSVSSSSSSVSPLFLRSRFNGVSSSPAFLSLSSPPSVRVDGLNSNHSAQPSTKILFLPTELPSSSHMEARCTTGDLLGPLGLFVQALLAFLAFTTLIGKSLRILFVC